VQASPSPEAADLPEPSGIGDRLRAERQRKGMTVREIARRVRVSPSLISQIERGKVNPSVSTLWGLVTVLGVPMSELFSDVETQPGQASVTPAAHTGPVTAPGTRSAINLETGVQWERLTTGSDALVEFLSVVYPPGASSCDEDSLVRHGGKEYGYVTGGRLGVRIGFDEYELGPGMAISFDASAPHRLWAIGEQPAEAIWIVVGRQNDGRVPPI
jgi:transcriptional regulator with XRE-family HTH domain